MSGPDSHADEAHTGPIKTPKQLLVTSFFAFVVPIFVIIGLVYNVVKQPEPATNGEDPAEAVARRIEKVGRVTLVDANRPLQTGEQVYKAVCAGCHATGAVGAPKFEDKAAWAPRIATGYEALLHSALKGKGAMAPQGGGAFSDVEVGRAVVYMANAAGAKFAEPAAPAGDKPADAASAAAPAMAAAPAAAPAPAAAATPVAAAAPAAGGVDAETHYKQVCAACHATGVAGAPKFGDKAAWAPRVAQGFDTVLAIATKGKGAMPPKGGSNFSDADFKAVVKYMVDAAK